MKTIESDVVRCIMTRRSIRRYREEQISEAELGTILEAGLHAPSAGGRQGVVFIVSQDREANRVLGAINKNAFKGRLPAGTYISKEQPSIADDSSVESGFYAAPTVITVLGDNPTYKEGDSAVAAENMLLAAHSLGVGACMIGRANETFASDYGKKILAELGVEDRFVAVCHVVLGYPDPRFPQPQAKPRRENRIYRLGERRRE